MQRLNTNIPFGKITQHLCIPTLFKTFFHCSLIHDSNIAPKNLTNLMIGGMQSMTEFSQLLYAFGSKLTTLKIETVSLVIPLKVIGQACPCLSELQIINAKVSTTDHECDKEKRFFERLRLVYFFFVKYKNPTINTIHTPPSALHCILYHASQLEGIQATGSSRLTDHCLENIISNNNLLFLKRFILTDACNSQQDNSEVNNIGLQTKNNDDSKPNLTSTSIIRLFGVCPKLTCVGDLRHWTLSTQEKREVCRKISSIHGGHWLVNAFEP